MDEVSVADIPAGSVVFHGKREWLVLKSHFGSPPFTFYPPWEMVLQPVPSGPWRTLRCTTARRMATLPTENREYQFVCRQGIELLLLEPKTGAMLSLPENRTRLDLMALEPCAPVLVVFFRGQLLWVTSHTELKTGAD